MNDRIMGRMNRVSSPCWASAVSRRVLRARRQLGRIFAHRSRASLEAPAGSIERTAKSNKASGWSFIGLLLTESWIDMLMLSRRSVPMRSQSFKSCSALDFVFANVAISVTANGKWPSVSESFGRLRSLRLLG